ncbi:hypothetical protein BC829DRAFT_402781 [Chytridium lagenaria]|nr:hypothetical protein BC829DRAFT_402781 [Chytridium lagenaria]
MGKHHKSGSARRKEKALRHKSSEVATQEMINSEGLSTGLAKIEGSTAALENSWQVTAEVTAPLTSVPPAQPTVSTPPSREELVAAKTSHPKDSKAVVPKANIPELQWLTFLLMSRCQSFPVLLQGLIEGMKYRIISVKRENRTNGTVSILIQKTEESEGLTKTYLDGLVNDSTASGARIAEQVKPAVLLEAANEPLNEIISDSVERHYTSWAELGEFQDSQLDDIGCVLIRESVMGPVCRRLFKGNGLELLGLRFLSELSDRRAREVMPAWMDLRDWCGGVEELSSARSSMELDGVCADGVQGYYVLALKKIGSPTGGVNTTRTRGESVIDIVKAAIATISNGAFPKKYEIPAKRMLSMLAVPGADADATFKCCLLRRPFLFDIDGCFRAVSREGGPTSYIIDNDIPKYGVSESGRVSIPAQTPVNVPVRRGFGLTSAWRSAAMQCR